MKLFRLPILKYLVALALVAATSAAANSYIASFTDNVVIPDNNLNGIAESETISTSITSISSLEVSLDISASPDSEAYNGDFYAYLTDGSGFAVLLNRVGAVSGNDYGYSDDGLDVTFSDTAPNGDIHFYGSGSYTVNTLGQVTGLYQPDGRNISPINSGGILASTPQTALLDGFDGLNPNGTWTLFVADASPGDVGELVNWSLDINGSAGPSVPDAGETAFLLSVGFGLLLTLRRRVLPQ